MGQLLSGPYLQRAVPVANEIGRPLTRPTHDGDQSLSQPFDVEVRQVTVRRAPARGRDAFGCRRFQFRRKRLIVGRQAGTPRVMVQDEFRSGAAHNRQVEWQDVGQEWRVLLSFVSQIQRPLDRRKIEVLDRLAANDQSFRWFAEDKRMRDALIIQLPGLVAPLPGLQHLDGWFTVDDKRERWIGRDGAGHCVEQRKLAQAQRATTGQQHFRVGPVGLIATDAIATIGNL